LYVIAAEWAIENRAEFLAERLLAFTVEINRYGK